MKKLTILLTSIFLVTACGVNKEGSQVKSVGKDKPFEITEICLLPSSYLNTWPVERAIDQWNMNQRTVFVHSSDTCEGYVFLHEMEMTIEQSMGETIFIQKPYTGIIVNSSVSNEIRLSTLCHELGHVLGMPHVSGQTCMDPEKDINQPSPGEIQQVRAQPWDWTIASRQAHGK